MLKKIVTPIVIAILAFMAQNSWAQPYTVSVQPLIVPPISPFVSQLLSPAGGGYVSAIIRNISAGGNGSVRVKLLGSIQRLSPSPFTISLNTNYHPQQPIILTGNAPVNLTSEFLKEVFGNFDISNLTFDGITADALKTGLGTNYKLPEGVYRICFSAYNYNAQGFGTPISAPGTGCSTFTICYQASAPQFVQPVNAMSLTSTVGIVNPTYPFLFSWTAPSLTCGGAINPLVYDLEIHAIYDGQTPTDALNNPPLFIKQGLPTPIFPFDTLLYRNILTLGSKYVVRVHATTGNSVNNAITFANSGYSAPEIFQYGVPPPKVDLIIVHNDNPSTPIGLLPVLKAPGLTVPIGKGGGTTTTPAPGAGGNCSVAAPTNTTPATQLSNGAALTIAGFKLTATTIKANGDGTFSGNGTIGWSPASAPIQLNVGFTSIKVNTSNEVFSGTITASLSPQVSAGGTDLSQFNSFAQQAGPQLDQLSSSVASFVKNNPATASISHISGSNPVSLPLGLDNLSMAGTPATFDIMSVVFSPTGATMSVLYNMQVPEASSSLTLVGANLCINPTGGFTAETGSLMLPADKQFTIGGGLTVDFKGSPGGDSTGGTYISWKSGAIQKILAHATITLPRTTIVPEDNSGNPASGQVTAQLIMNFSDWDDWVASVDLPHFEVPGVKGLSFQPTNIYYDHSTKQNATGFKAPSDYTGTTNVDFEGLYIKDLTVLLPTTFSTFGSGGNRTSFTANDFIMDNDGVSADIKGYKIIETNGSLGGWSFTLDTVKVDIVQNTFKSGSFAGGIFLPVSKTPIHYDGDMQVGGDGSVQYNFIAKPEADMNFDLWAAQVTLDQNSSISIGTDAQGTAIAATLNGKASLNAGSISFPGLSFNGLGFSNRNNGSNGFHLNEGIWSFASPQKYIETYASKDDDKKDDDNSGDVNGFPVSINNIAPYFNQSVTGTTENINLGVSFDLNITLGDASVISGTTHLDIYGSLKASVSNSFAPSINVGGPTVKLDTINVNGDVGPVSISGTLILYKQNATFGNGFKGQVSADFSIVSGQATAQFGSVNGYNYWFVDASLNLPPPGILLGSSSLSISGFGGGAYYNMKMTQGTLPDPSKLPTANNADNTAGKSSSGAAYVPSKGTAGMMASLSIDDLNPAILSATVTLIAQITNGSLSEIAIDGSASILSGVVQDDIEISWVIPEKQFEIDMTMKANFLLVKADVPFHFLVNPGGFYFKLGDPNYMNTDKTKEINLQLSQVSTAIFSENIGFQAYFAMGVGTGSEFQMNFPGLPNYITQAGLKPSQMATDIIKELNSSTKDASLLFGARGNFDISFNLAIFYASGNFDFGFDLDIAQYVNAQCNGNQIGFDGWYALGQLYANLSFDIGINVDVWFFSGKLDLCNFGAAALLQGGLPNPIWVSGDAEAHGSLLDGLLSFNTNFHFTVGNPCYPTPHDPLQDIQIITDYGPTDSCSIYDKPYFASNEGLDRNFSIPMPPSSQYPNGSTRTFKFQVTSYKLTYKDSSGNTKEQNITLHYEDGDHKSLNIEHEATLQPNTKYTMTMVCNAKQLEGSNPYQSPTSGGTWTDPYIDSLQKNVPMHQTKQFEFVTGPAPSNIPDKLVHFTYPVNKQRYLLKKEFGGKGVMQFNEWPDYLFDNTAIPSGSHLEYLVYFIEVGGNDTLTTTFTPQNIGKGGQLNFTFPAALKNSTIYREEFWKLIVAPPPPAPANTLTVSTRTLDLNYGGSLGIQPINPLTPVDGLQTGIPSSTTPGSPITIQPGSISKPVAGLQPGISLTPASTAPGTPALAPQVVNQSNLPKLNINQNNNALSGSANLTTSGTLSEVGVKVTSRDGSAANTPSTITGSLTSNAQNFTHVLEKNSNLLGGGKVAAPKPQPLYVLNFGTSGYDYITNKIDALTGGGTWIGYQNDNNGAYTVINPGGSSNKWELFDSYEMNGYTTPDKTKMPGMLGIDIPWDDNNAGDKCIANFYQAGQNVVDASHGGTLKVEYESAGVDRDDKQRPINALTWSSSTWSDPILSASDCTYGGQTNEDADLSYANSPTLNNPFVVPAFSGVLVLNWNASPIVAVDENTQTVLAYCLNADKNLLAGLRNGNNYGINLSNYNLLQNAHSAVPFGAVGATGKAIATNLRNFANDAAYFKSSGSYTTLMNNYVNAGINTIRCDWPPDINTTGTLKFTYNMQGYNTVTSSQKIKYVAAPIITNNPGSSGGTGNPPGTGTKKIKQDANP